MPRPSRQTIVLGGVMLLAVAGTLVVLLSNPRGVDIGFWFDPISADTLETLPERLGGELSGAEMKTIEVVAVQEIAPHFETFRLHSLKGGTPRIEFGSSTACAIRSRHACPLRQQNRDRSLGWAGRAP